jgi:hypothetical protein
VEEDLTEQDTPGRIRGEQPHGSVRAGDSPVVPGGDLRRSQEPILVRKNWKRAFWSLLIVVFFVPVSAWLVFLGLQPGRAEVSWSLVLFGVLGVLAFGGSAILIVRTMRAPWRLELTPAHLSLYTPTYDLSIPWEEIAGIAVDEEQRRQSCVLFFEEVAEVVRLARFHPGAARPDAVTNARVMQARMEESFAASGYHLAIPGRILEMGAEELAEQLTRARTGKLWPEEPSR